MLLKSQKLHNLKPAMFDSAKAFNQPIGQWDVSQVTNMSSMFHGAGAFNQPIEQWDVAQVTEMSFMFYKAKLSTRHYDSTLIAWSTLPKLNALVFDAGSSQYSKAAIAARQKLIDEHGWKIEDGGLTP